MNRKSITISIAITIIRLVLLVCTTSMLPQQTLGQQKAPSPSVSPEVPPIHVFELSAYSKQLELGANVQYYEDAAKTLTFENITSPDVMNSKWQIYTKQTLSFGFKRSAYWLRFALRSTIPQHNDWLFEVAFPTLDSIELYSPQADGRYTRHVMGDYLPFSEREVKYRTFLKRLDMPDSLPRVYYLRINIKSTLFALALSHQYKVLQQEKKRTQEENFRLIRDANESLKSAVEKRTAELQEKNVDLETANEEIQRQIDVQSEQAREIELANTTLHEQNEKLSALDREKNEIMGIVAHDLKNPISAVRGLAELVQSGFAEAEQIPEIIGQIVQTTDRMLELVKNLLDVNRLESGAIQFRLIEFDIAPMVESAIWQYTQPAEVKRITLHYSKETSSSIVIADEQATMQVLDNIVSNAVKYSPHGKQVFIRVLRHEHTVRVEIEDQGQGLSDEDKSKVFEKFARLSARPTGGEYSTGLGLSIVKKMVGAMNGKVWCESEYGKGATFIIELPSPSPSTPQSSASS